MCSPVMVQPVLGIPYRLPNNHMWQVMHPDWWYSDPNSGWSWPEGDGLCFSIWFWEVDHSLSVRWRYRSQMFLLWSLSPFSPLPCVTVQSSTISGRLYKVAFTLCLFEEMLALCFFIFTWVHFFKAMLLLSESSIAFGEDWLIYPILTEMLGNILMINQLTLVLL